jgi:nucleoside-diphosphate-sugar epimerase
MRVTDGTVLVTGGAGFSGGYVLRRLLELGYRPVAFDVMDYKPETRFIVGPSIEDIPLERGSIDDWPALVRAMNRHRPTAIIHLASLMDLPFQNEHPIVSLQVNVGGAINVFEAARTFDVGRVITLSTIAVIPEVRYEPLDGNHPVILSSRGPRDAYTAAKLSVEAYGHFYSHLHGLDVRTIRPSALYGLGMNPLSSNYMKQIVEPAVRGEPVHLATGGPVPRDYIHVSDLASLVGALLQGPDDADRLFYAGTGRALRTGGDVGSLVRELVPGSVVDIGDAFADADYEDLPCRGVISIQANVTQLGWTPLFGDLREGVAEYIGRYREYLGARS